MLARDSLCIRFLKDYTAGEAREPIKLSKCSYNEISPRKNIKAKNSKQNQQSATATGILPGTVFSCLPHKSNK